MQKYTPEAQDVLKKTGEIAQYFNCEYFNTDHLLLAVLDVGARTKPIMGDLEVSVGSIRSQICHQIGKREGPPLPSNVVITQSPRAGRVLTWAQEEAKLLRTQEIGSEAIVLGILRDGECLAAQCLNKNRVSYHVFLEKTRARYC